MHSNNNLVWFSLSAFRYSNSNIEKYKSKKIFFYDIRHPDEYRKLRKSKKKIDIRLYVEYWKTIVKKFLIFAITMNIEKRISKIFWHSPSWWISKKESQNFFRFSIFIMMANVNFFFFAFRFSIFEFEFRKAKKENQTKLLLICTCILNRKIHY